MREIWLNIDCKVVLEDVEKPHRIAIVNPEALKDISAERLRVGDSFSSAPHYENFVVRGFLFSLQKSNQYAKITI